MPRQTLLKSTFTPRARTTPATLERLLATAQRLDMTPSELVGVAVADFVRRFDDPTRDGQTPIETAHQQVA